MGEMIFIWNYIFTQKNNLHFKQRNSNINLNSYHWFLIVSYSKTSWIWSRSKYIWNNSFVFNSHGSDTSYENEWILAVQDIKTISILDCMFKSTQLNKQIKTMITYTETKRVNPSIQAFTS